MSNNSNINLILKWKEKYTKYKMLYNCIFLSFLFFLHCFWGGFSYIVFPILAFFMITSNIEDGFSYICFGLPFYIINADISSYIYYISILLYIIKSFFIVFVKEKQKIDLKLLILILVFLCYILLPFGNYNKNWILKFCYFIFIFTAIIALRHKPQIYNAEKNVKIISISLILSSLLCLLQPISTFLQSHTLLEIDITERFPALLGHPNTLAIFCEIILSALTYFIIKKPSNKFNSVLFLAVSLIGIVTQSKIFIIILFFLLSILTFKFFKINKKITTLVIFAFLFFICLLIAVFPDFSTTLFNRFFDSLKIDSIYHFFDSLLTGRLDMWHDYLKFIFTHPKTLIFGNGLGANTIQTTFINHIGDKVPFKISPHNFYISLIYQLGIVGTLLLISVVICSLKQIKTKPINKAILIPIIVIALIFLIEDSFLYIM